MIAEKTTTDVFDDASRLQSFLKVENMSEVLGRLCLRIAYAEAAAKADDYVETQRLLMAGIKATEPIMEAMP